MRVHGYPPLSDRCSGCGERLEELSYLINPVKWDDGSQRCVSSGWPRGRLQRLIGG